MVVLVASWSGFRIPIAIATIDPERKGHQNILFRQMLRDFEPPSWVREIVVLGDAGYPANPTLKLIQELGWTYVFAMPRTRKFTDGKYVRDLVQHLPKSLYRRRATYKPDGRRQDYWVFMRHAELHQLGDVTIVLSKKRRNLGPKRVKIIVTNLLDVSASAVISQYAVRWQVEIYQSCNLRRTLFGSKMHFLGSSRAQLVNILDSVSYTLPPQTTTPSVFPLQPHFDHRYASCEISCEEVAPLV
jgi:hypothetical protein